MHNTANIIFVLKDKSALIKVMFLVGQGTESKISVFLRRPFHSDKTLNVSGEAK